MFSLFCSPFQALFHSGVKNQKKIVKGGQNCINSTLPSFPFVSISCNAKRALDSGTF